MVEACVPVEFVLIGEAASGLGEYIAVSMDTNLISFGPTLESVCLSSLGLHTRLKMRSVPCSGVSLAVQCQISCPALLHEVVFCCALALVCISQR